MYCPFVRGYWKPSSRSVMVRLHRGGAVTWTRTCIRTVGYKTFCCGPRKALTRRGRGPGRSNLNTRERWGLHRDDTEVSGGESSPSRALGEEVETWFAPGSRGSVVVPYRVRCWETSQVRVQQDPVDVEHLAPRARYNGHAGAPRSVAHGRRRPGQGKSLPG